MTASILCPESEIQSVEYLTMFQTSIDWNIVCGNAVLFWIVPRIERVSEVEKRSEKPFVSWSGFCILQDLWFPTSAYKCHKSSSNKDTNQNPFPQRIFVFPTNAPLLLTRCHKHQIELNIRILDFCCSKELAAPNALLFPKTPNTSKHQNIYLAPRLGCTPSGIVSRALQEPYSDDVLNTTGLFNLLQHIKDDLDKRVTSCGRR